MLYLESVVSGHLDALMVPRQPPHHVRWVVGTELRLEKWEWAVLVMVSYGDLER